MTADDPTSAILTDLDDLSKYRCVRNVPVFLEHCLTRIKRKPNGDPVLDEDGNPVIVEVEVTSDDIDNTVENMQAWEAEGGLRRLSFGHTISNPNAPEDSQPEPVGYSRNARAVNRNGKRTIVEDWYIMADRYSDAKTYPFRSAEYYGNRKLIKGTALLRRDAELNLGALAYAGEGVYHYAMENTMPDDFDQGPPIDPAAPDAGAPGPDDDAYTEFAALCDRYMAEKYPSLRAMVEKYAAEMTPPPGDDTASLMGNGAPGGTLPPDTGAEMTPMQAEQMTRYQQEAVAAKNESRKHHGESQKLAEENKKLREELGKSKTDALIHSLKNTDGVVIKNEDRVRNKMLAMSDSDREDYAAEIRESYERDITRGEFIPVAPSSKKGGATGKTKKAKLSPEVEQLAQKYQHEHADDPQYHSGDALWEGAVKYAQERVGAN